VIPDVSQVKSIRHYFNRRNLPIWPAWLYHPSKKPLLVRNAEEAAEIGVCYRDATVDERGKYGRSHVWDWKDDCLWRPNPYDVGKIDPSNPGTGKTLSQPPANPIVAQNAMIADLVPAVAAAVVQSLKSSSSVAPENIDKAQWEEFLKFQAWKKTSEATNALTSDNISSFTFARDNQERILLEQEATRKGIRIDGRWSLDRLKAEVEKAM
jgi:hypothetical protein